MKKDTYIAPKVEVYEIEAEQGFSATGASLVSALHGWDSDSNDDYDDVAF